MMPGINGLDLIKEIKKKCNDIVFVIISAYEYYYFAKEAIEPGVLDYILKPVDKDVVISTINKAQNISYILIVISN